MSNVQDPNHPTGVTTTPGDPGGTALATARTRKALSAVNLKVKGYKLEDIAIALGYRNGAAVAVAIETALSTELRDIDKAALRNVAGRRLEQAWRSLHGKINDPDSPDHIAAVNAGIKVIDRHARLMGLDAPTEMVISSPSAQELQEYVDAVLSAQQALATGSGVALEEADVLDIEGEWLDDEVEEILEDDIEEVLDVPVPTR